MPLAFPIAANARDALFAQTLARTVAEARERHGSAVTLVSEFVRPTAAEHRDMVGLIDAGLASGFVQIYADARQRPVIGVTYWKPRAAPAAQPPQAAEDHTDDLYFSKARTRRRSRRGADPGQLDLFRGPDQQGDEKPDPDNPEVMLVVEEGTGEAFGLAPTQPTKPARRTRRRKPAPDKDQGKDRPDQI